MHEEVLTKEKIALILNADLAANGESVWDVNVYARDPNIASRDYVFSKPLSHTSQLARDFMKPTTSENEPNSWVASQISDQEWRLYLRIGESYSEVGSHVLTPPIKVAINSKDEFTRLFKLPKNQWWEAPFSCPYCGTLCVERKRCAHLLTTSNYVHAPFRDSPFENLFYRMWERRFNCGIINANIEGLKIKLPRVFHRTEWFVLRIGIFKIHL